MNLKLEKGYTIVEPFEIDLPDLTILTGLNGAGKSQILNGISTGLIKTDLDGEIISTNYSNLTDSDIHPNAALPYNLTPTEMLGIYQEYLGSFEDEEQNPIFKDRDWIFRNIAQVTKKDVRSLRNTDIVPNWPIEYDLIGKGLFFQNFNRMFFRYLKKLVENDHKSFLAAKYPNSGVEFLTDEEFIAMNGEAPWDYGNKILIQYGSDYEFINPTNLYIDFDIDQHFKFTLQHKVTGAEIEFNNLSSGEKTLMSLFFSIYNSSKETQIPALLLLDEPDASLHPSLIKQFLHITKEVFILERGIKVILTTHSPTTVALADEESIYSVCSPGARIEKITKDGALKLLTEGVPSFSVNYENRRHVFVESQNDVEYYENLYNIFSSELEPQISLNFIAAGAVQKNKHGGNNDGSPIVISATKVLSENKFIYGIVDYDNKNIPNDYLKVLGYRKRYAIENYILDPLLLATFLLMINIEKAENLGLKPETAYSDISDLDTETLQIVTNSILERIKEFCEINSEELVTCKLYNGIELQMPKWFLIHKGHKLEENIIKAFKGLDKYSNPEKKLKMSIIRNVISNYPELASEDLIQILKEVQK